MFLKLIRESKGGEIYVSKILSFKVVDLAQAISPECELKEVGTREGESSRSYDYKGWQQKCSNLKTLYNISLILIGGLKISILKMVGKELKTGLNIIPEQIKNGFSVEDLRKRLELLNIKD